MTELVALTPSGGKETHLTWYVRLKDSMLLMPSRFEFTCNCDSWLCCTRVNVTYPEDVSSCNQVSFSDGTGAAVLGAFDSLDLETPLKLTGKNYGDFFYGYVNTGRAPSDGSCCADTMRIWSMSDGSSRDIDLVEPLANLPFNSSTFAYATHTFDVALLNGETVAYCMAQFEEDGSMLNKAKVDVVVAISMETGLAVPTVSGDAYFSLWEKLGTLSEAPSDSVYKVQFTALSDDPNNDEEWHGNGVSAFTTADGTDILGVTHRNLNEAILLSNPWTTDSGSGGGAILQRFGLVANGNTEVDHIFGLSSEDAGAAWDGLHNVVRRLSLS